MNASTELTTTTFTTPTTSISESSNQHGSLGFILNVVFSIVLIFLYVLGLQFCIKFFKGRRLILWIIFITSIVILTGAFIATTVISIVGDQDDFNFISSMITWASVLGMLLLMQFILIFVICSVTVSEKHPHVTWREAFENAHDEIWCCKKPVENGGEPFRNLGLRRPNPPSFRHPRILERRNDPEIGITHRNYTENGMGIAFDFRLDGFDRNRSRTNDHQAPVENEIPTYEEAMKECVSPPSYKQVIDKTSFSTFKPDLS